MRTFGSIKLVKDYIEEKAIKRIVLLEDFIGNGGQVSKAVKFAAENLNDIPILIIPLIICPAGLQQAKMFTASHRNINILPVISVDSNYFVHEIENDNETDFFKNIHLLAKRTYNKVTFTDLDFDETTPPYGPFGWRKTGGLIVMHTNTPNNTLPLIHHKSETWNPLFKRHKRI